MTTRNGALGHRDVAVTVFADDTDVDARVVCGAPTDGPTDGPTDIASMSIRLDGGAFGPLWKRW